MTIYRERWYHLIIYIYIVYGTIIMVHWHLLMQPQAAVLLYALLLD